MEIIIQYAFLFVIGSVSGWVMELFYRRFVSASNPERKWINPGFCTGPYLPIYGCGLCILYLIASLEELRLIENSVWNKIVLFLTMAICMTVIEYIAGVIVLKSTHVRLWDYSNEWANIQGIICPKFSLIWAILGALYYFFIHPHILDALKWLSANLAFSFVIGMFLGVFAVDVAISAQLVTKLKKFARENNVIVRYEAIKADIRKKYDNTHKKYRFFRPFRTELPLSEHLREMIDSFEQQAETIHKKFTKNGRND